MSMAEIAWCACDRRRRKLYRLGYSKKTGVVVKENLGELVVHNRNKLSKDD